MAVADAFVQQLFGDASRQLIIVVQRDDVEHHIQRRRAARTGQPVPVDFEQLGCEFDVRITFDQPGQILPMHRAAVTVEQTGPGQDGTAGAQGAEGAAPCVQPAQPADHLAVIVVMGIDATANEQHRVGINLRQREINGNLNAIRCRDRAAVGGNQVAIIEPPAADMLGQAQRLDRRRQRDHGEARQQKKSNPARLPARQFLRHANHSF